MDQIDARELFARESEISFINWFAVLLPEIRTNVRVHVDKTANCQNSKCTISASSPEVERYERDEDDRENREPRGHGDSDDNSRDRVGGDDEAIEVPAPKVLHRI